MKLKIAILGLVCALFMAAPVLAHEEDQSWHEQQQYEPHGGHRNHVEHERQRSHWWHHEHRDGEHWYWPEHHHHDGEHHGEHSEHQD